MSEDFIGGDVRRKAGDKSVLRDTAAGQSPVSGVSASKSRTAGNAGGQVPHHPTKPAVRGLAARPMARATSCFGQRNQITEVNNAFFWRILSLLISQRSSGDQQLKYERARALPRVNSLNKG